MFFDVPRQLETRSVRQTDIENNQVPEALIKLPQRSLPGLYPRHVIAFARQPFAKRRAQRTIVFDQQQTLHDSPRAGCAKAGWAAALGKFNSTTKPFTSPR